MSVLVSVIGGFLLLFSITAAITDNSQQGLTRLAATDTGLPPAQIAPFVVQRIGLTQARRLVLTSAQFDGREALRLGLVHVAQGHIDKAKAVLLKLQSLRSDLAGELDRALDRHGVAEPDLVDRVGLGETQPVHRGPPVLAVEVAQDDDLARLERAARPVGKARGLVQRLAGGETWTAPTASPRPGPARRSRSSARRASRSCC